jgi:hypothetical protein
MLLKPIEESIERVSLIQGTSIAAAVANNLEICFIREENYELACLSCYSVGIRLPLLCDVTKCRSSQRVGFQKRVLTQG